MCVLLVNLDPGFWCLQNNWIIQTNVFQLRNMSAQIIGANGDNERFNQKEQKKLNSIECSKACIGSPIKIENSQKNYYRTFKLKNRTSDRQGKCRTLLSDAYHHHRTSDRIKEEIQTLWPTLDADFIGRRKFIGRPITVEKNLSDDGIGNRRTYRTSDTSNG